MCSYQRSCLITVSRYPRRSSPICRTWFCVNDSDVLVVETMAFTGTGTDGSVRVVTVAEETYRFMLRIPASLRDRLLAVKGGRSLNREIEVRLLLSFDITVPDITEEEKEAAKRIGDSYRVRPTDYLVREGELGERKGLREGNAGAPNTAPVVEAAPSRSPSASQEVQGGEVSEPLKDEQAGNQFVARTGEESPRTTPSGSLTSKRPRTKHCEHRISPEAFCVRCDLS